MKPPRAPERGILKRMAKRSLALSTLLLNLLRAFRAIHPRAQHGPFGRRRVSDLKKALMGPICADHRWFFYGIQDKRLAWNGERGLTLTLHAPLRVSGS